MLGSTPNVYGPADSPVHASRSSYPSFLPLSSTLKLHVGFFWRGIIDASRWDTTLRIIYSDSEIRSHVLKSFVLNGLSLVSIYAFDLLLLPLIRGQQKWIHRNVSWFYRVFWLVPLAAVSLYLNGTWAGVVAKQSYKLQYGLRTTIPSPSYSGLLTALASSAYRVVMIITSIFLTFAFSYIPIAGPPVAFAFLCFVNAWVHFIHFHHLQRLTNKDRYYCFEFIWITRGLTLSQRVRFVEERWAYYFAFGLPSAALCAFCSSFAGAAMFAILLPYYIIKAVHARPVPTHPYAPLPPSPTRESQASSTILHPSPFVPIRIPVFDIVIKIDNFIVRLLSVGSHSSKGTRKATQLDGEKWHLSGDPDVANSIEEGCFPTKNTPKPNRKLD